jgi:plastocyanin
VFKITDLKMNLSYHFADKLFGIGGIMKMYLLIGVVVVFIVGFALLSRDNMNVDISNPSSQTTIASNSVSIENFSFNPAALTIETGTTVTWTNNDSAIHNLKSAQFNSAVLNTGDTFKFTFTSSGTYNYSCGLHPTMTGAIIVQ